MVAVLLLSPLAVAATLEAWVADDFPVNDAPLAGVDGWKNGYDADEWAGVEIDGETWAYSNTDHTDGGSFGDGGAHDNWLTHAAVPVSQGVYSVTTWASDNDALGVVFGAKAGSYYLFLVCGEEGNETGNQTCPVAGLTTQAISLVEVRGGTATVLETVERGCTGGQAVPIRVAMDNGQLVARYGNVELSMEVDADFRMDGVGFYAYNNGFYDEAGENDGDSVYFSGPRLDQQDEDDDGVADDSDNCEVEPNPGQEDLDGDGLGSPCDDEEVIDPGDTGAPDDTGDPQDTGKGPNGAVDAGIVINGRGDCGCGSATTPAAWLALGAAMLAAGRTRVRR